jgi:hypothetical protein
MRFQDREVLLRFGQVASQTTTLDPIPGSVLAGRFAEDIGWPSTAAQAEGLRRLAMVLLELAVEFRARADNLDTSIRNVARVTANRAGAGPSQPNGEA